MFVCLLIIEEFYFILGIYFILSLSLSLSIYIYTV